MMSREISPRPGFVPGKRPSPYGTYRPRPRYLIGLDPAVAARAAWLRAGCPAPAPPVPEEPRACVIGPSRFRRIVDPDRWRAAYAELADEAGGRPTAVALAEEVGCSPIYARQIARRLGLPLWRRPPGPIPGSRQHRIWMAFRDAGPSPAARIARSLGLTDRVLGKAMPLLVRRGYLRIVGHDPRGRANTRLYAAVAPEDRP